MAVTTDTRARSGRLGLGGATVAEAFQPTAPAHPDRCALRTEGRRVLDHLARVRRQGAPRGRRARRAGPRARATRWRSCSRTGPSSTGSTPRRMHLGATPFSIYNTYTPEQIQYQVNDAEARIVVTEQAFADRVRALDGVEHLIVVDDGRTDVEQHAPQSFDFEAAWRAVEPDDLLTLIYTSGTTGPPKGVQLTHANLIGAVHGFDEMIAFPDDGRVISWLPMAHIAERACVPLPADVARLHHHLLPGPAPGGGLPAGGAARPGSSPCRASGRSSRRRSRPASRPSRTRSASRRPQWALDVGLRKVARAGRRAGAEELRGAREGRRARAVEDPRAARARPGRVGERGRGARRRAR